MIEDQFSEIVAGLGGGADSPTQQSSGARIAQAGIQLADSTSAFELALARQRTYNEACSKADNADELPDEMHDMAFDAETGMMEALTRGVLSMGSSLLAIAQTLETLAAANDTRRAGDPGE